MTREFFDGGPAAIIAQALGGRRSGSGWVAPCPAHDDSTPSLSISETRDGLLLVHCFAGCSQANVIAELRARHLWLAREVGRHVPAIIEKPKTGRCLDPDLKRRIARALRPWCEANSAAGSQVELYLRSRGIVLPMPNALRFHPRLKHCSKSIWPAMIALVTIGADARPVGVHRTWLASDGCGKAPVSPSKMMLGPCRGGVVRLAPPLMTLMIGEGIETCLAAMQATGCAAWAALSTSGLRALELPEVVRDVILLADGDQPGEAAALSAARRLSTTGRRVRIARPPTGTDFNDLLVHADGSTEESRR